MKDNKTARFSIEYERARYHGIVFRRYSFTKKDWRELVRRVGVHQYEPERIVSVTIDTNEYGQCLIVGVTVENEKESSHEEV